jgi:hypothetical protein
VEEAREKSNKTSEKSQLHMKLYQEDIKANLARDPDFNRRLPASAHMQREFLDSWSKKALDAACAVWHKHFDCQLPEIMTTDQCNEALKIGFELLLRKGLWCSSKHGTQREPPPRNVCHQ